MPAHLHFRSFDPRGMAKQKHGNRQV